MPAKRKYAKKFTRKARKGKLRPKRTNKRMLIYSHPKQPLPPRYRCQFENILNGVVSAGSAATQQFSVGLNTLYYPWDAAGIVSGLTPFPGPISYDVTTLQPQGYSNLCQSDTSDLSTRGPYQYYKVYASKISIVFMPVSASDNIYMSVVPTLRPADVANSGVPTNFQSGLPDPFERLTTFGTGFTPKPLKKFIRVAELIGLTNKMLMDDLSGQYSSGTDAEGPVRTALWNVSYQTCDNTATNNPIGYTVRVQWYCELYGLLGTRYDQS